MRRGGAAVEATRIGFEIGQRGRFGDFVPSGADGDWLKVFVDDYRQVLLEQSLALSRFGRSVQTDGWEPSEEPVSLRGVDFAAGLPALYFGSGDGEYYGSTIYDPASGNVLMSGGWRH